MWKNIFVARTPFFFFYLKLGVILVFVGYIVVLFRVRLAGFIADEPPPFVHGLSIEQRNKFKEFRSVVNTGLHIKNFSIFDISKNFFVVDAVIWFKFSPSQLNAEVIDSFSIKNAKIISKSAPDVKVVKDQLVMTYQVIFELKTNLLFRSYPLEDHALYIVLINNFVTPIEMHFDDRDNAHSLSVSRNFGSTSWGVESTKIQPGVTSEQPTSQDKTKFVEFPCVVYTINFMQLSYKTLFTLFAPIFAAGIFSWLSLLLNLSNEVGRFSLAITAVTAILGYRFVIEQVSPQVGYYTILDKMYLFLLGFSFFIFIFHMIITAYWYVINKRIEAEDAQQDLTFSKELHGKFLNFLMNVAFVIGAVLLYTLTLYFIFY